jgi:hypothetical protein
MIRAIAARILRQILLVVVGAEAFSCTEITELSGRGQSTGRHSVDVDVDPAVDPLQTVETLNTGLPSPAQAEVPRDVESLLRLRSQVMLQCAAQPGRLNSAARPQVEVNIRSPS